MVKNKTYYEGIPLTTAEGSTIEDIDMETIGSIEIIKDLIPALVLVLGGVINLFAREIPMDEFRLSNHDLWKFRTFETKFFWKLW
jgi:hypothetical protein